MSTRLDPLTQRPYRPAIDSYYRWKISSAICARPRQRLPVRLRLYYMEGGQVHYTSLTPGAVEDVSLTVEMDLDFNQTKLTVFDQAWRYLNENFHDPDFHGANWQAIHNLFAPHIAGAHTPVETRRLLALMDW